MKWWLGLIIQIGVFSFIVFVFQKLFQNRMEIRLYEHNVKFSQLHNKRGEVIADLYSKLADAHRAARGLTTLIEFAGTPPKRERYSQFVNAWNEYIIFLDRNKLFLSEKTTSLFDSFSKEVAINIAGFQAYILYGNEERVYDNEALKKWAEVAEQISKGDVVKLREALEKELKKTIDI